MEIEIKQRKKFVLFKFNGKLIINDIVQVHLEVTPVLIDNEAIIIDLSNVSHIDTPGFQFLIYIKNLARSKDKKFKLINHSEPILKYFDLYGAIGYFQDNIKINNEQRKLYDFNYGLRKYSINLQEN